MSAKRNALAVFLAVICLTVSWPLNHATAQTQPPANGDWDVYDNTTISNTQVLLQGDLNVYGNLTLDNVDLYMYGTSNGHRSINVHDGGSLEIIDSEVLPYISTYYYDFLVLNGGELSVFDSIIRKITTIEVQSAEINLQNTSIFDSQQNGILISGTSNYSLDNLTIKDAGLGHGSSNNCASVYECNGISINLNSNTNRQTIISNLTIINSWNSGILHESLSQSHTISIDIIIVDSQIKGSKGESQILFRGYTHNATVLRTDVIDAGQGGPGLGAGNSYGIKVDNAMLYVVNSNISNNSNIKMTTGTGKQVGHNDLSNPIVSGIFAESAVIENSVISNNGNLSNDDFYDDVSSALNGIGRNRIKCSGVSSSENLVIRNSTINDNCIRDFVIESYDGRGTGAYWLQNAYQCRYNQEGFTSSNCGRLNASGITIKDGIIDNTSIFNNAGYSLVNDCVRFHGSSSSQYSCGNSYVKASVITNYAIELEGSVEIKYTQIENNSFGRNVVNNISSLSSGALGYYQYAIWNFAINFYHFSTQSVSLYLNNSILNSLSCSTTNNGIRLTNINPYCGTLRVTGNVIADIVNTTMYNDEVIEDNAIINRYWYIDVNLTDADLEATPNALVQLRESNNFIIDSGNTDENGKIRFIAKEYFEDANNKVSYTPHIITSTVGGYSNSSNVDISTPTTAGTNPIGNVYLMMQDNVPDAFPNDTSQDYDSDGDGYGDNATGTNPDRFVNNPTQWNDTDGDGYGDNCAIQGACWQGNYFPNATQSDSFPVDPTQWNDTDGDGYGDNISGNNPDSCPNQFGNSTANATFGCLDSDGDLWADSQDSFPNDASQWNDSDGDGFGDSPTGTNPDACPTTFGNSTIDRFGCLDQDGDGYSDQIDYCPTEAGNSTLGGKIACPDADGDGWSDIDDAIDDDATQWQDADGDGFGDNASGNNPDSCPSVWGNSTANATFGCPDSDGDSWADSQDDFITDPTQYIDTDGDGYGDNQSGNNPDAFINDVTQWSDVDGDGYGDNQFGNTPDLFPNDSTQWNDTDGDGYGDNPNGNNGDAFPNDFTQWSDGDGDGYGDNPTGNNPDQYPTDPTQWIDTDGDGYGDNASGTNGDDFPNDATQWSDTDGDGYGDNSTGNNPDQYPTDPTQWIDTDGDGYGDNASGTNGDDFPNDATQWSDSDGDGFGDNPSGTTPDSCITVSGNSTANSYYGCPDLDGDGWANVQDAFISDPTQWSDADGDGYGDNPNGNYPDACPSTYGNSTSDQYGCVDSDGDAISDQNDDFPNDPLRSGDADQDGYDDSLEDDCWGVWGNSTQDRVGCPDADGDGYSDGDLNWTIANGSDAFPTESSQWDDSDGDGFGDNLTGFEGDDCIFIAGNSTAGGIYGCVDTDSDSWANTIDDFPYDYTQWLDSDGDGFGDNQFGNNADNCPSTYGTSNLDVNGCLDSDNDGWSDSGDNCPSVYGNSTANSYFGCLDSDGDTYADSQDSFPNDVTQWSDVDADGYGDNTNGTTPDACPTIFGNSTIDRYGCTDQDGDGHSDINDQFPYISSQWNDTDGDGYGDNFNGFEGDECPTTFGTSMVDRYGCLDSDNDGVSDAGDDFPADGSRTTDIDGDGFDDIWEDDCPTIWGGSTEDVQGCRDTDGDGWSDVGDDFPNQSTQWIDTDGDGYGDNILPGSYQPDDCPNTIGNSSNDRYGCIDGDGDGWSDAGDDFPNQSTQWLDSDGDGYGDNLWGYQADACVDQYGTSTTDRYGCIDSDSDGVSDQNDDFPNDPLRSGDTDGDGLDGSFEDDCPTIWGSSVEDRAGCVDSDGDGWSDPDVNWNVSDGADAYPNDATQWIDSDGDGYGDNSAGTYPDACPTIYGNSTANQTLGCLDTDGDSWADIDDAFPNQVTQWIDSDGDGYGDNWGNLSWNDTAPNFGYGEWVDGAYQPDYCPAAFGNSTIDVFGCYDADGDGYSYLVDICPRTNSDLVANESGCADNQIDSDGDGYYDYEDLCPNESDNTDVDNDGIADCVDDFIDQDNDGVIDQIDICPNTNPDAENIDVLGCSELQVDTDRDGLPDYEDVDDDNDGLLDILDSDPFTPNIERMHEFTFEIEENHIDLVIIYKVGTATSVANANLADYLTNFGSQPDGVLDSGEQDALETMMCNEPELYAPEFTFEHLIENITVIGYTLTPGEIDCEWREKRMISTSDFTTESLEISVTIQINNTLQLPFSLEMSSDVIGKATNIDVEYDSDDIVDDDTWWPWYENYTLTIADPSTSTTDDSDNQNDITTPTDDNDDTDDSQNNGNPSQESSSTAGASDDAEIVGAMGTLVLILGIALFVSMRRSKKKNEELLMQVNKLMASQANTSEIAPPSQQSMPSAITSYVPHIDSNGTVDANGYEWIQSPDGTNWYRIHGTKNEWTKFES